MCVLVPVLRLFLEVLRSCLSKPFWPLGCQECSRKSCPLSKVPPFFKILNDHYPNKSTTPHLSSPSSADIASSVFIKQKHYKDLPIPYANYGQKSHL